MGKARAGEGTLRELLEREPEVAARLRPNVLAACFDARRLLRHADSVFERVFGTVSEDRPG